MSKTCTVDGCVDRACRTAGTLCEKHYMRLRRNGTTEKVGQVKPGLLEHTGGYLLAYLPDHPLRRAQGRVYEHRAVFYETHGAGPFNCHCCGGVVTWEGMHVDHLDDDPKNNAPSNLAPACPTCNQKRGQHKVMATLRRKHGLTIDGITLTINEWAARVGAVNGSNIAARLKRGWTARQAVMTPARQQPA